MAVVINGPKLRRRIVEPGRDYPLRAPQMKGFLGIREVETAAGTSWRSLPSPWLQEFALPPLGCHSCSQRTVCALVKTCRRRSLDCDRRERASAPRRQRASVYWW